MVVGTLSAVILAMGFVLVMSVFEMRYQGKIIEAQQQAIGHSNTQIKLLRELAKIEEEA